MDQELLKTLLKELPDNPSPLFELYEFWNEERSAGEVLIQRHSGQRHALQFKLVGRMFLWDDVRESWLVRQIEPAAMERPAVDYDIYNRFDMAGNRTTHRLSRAILRRHPYLFNSQRIGEDN